MKNLTLFVFLIVVISSCKKEQRDPALFYYPAEWEPQEAMLMGWTERQQEFFPLVVDVAVDSSAEKEELVKEIFSSLYPDKQLVWIDATVYNWRGGRIHCYTKQVPKAN